MMKNKIIKSISLFLTVCTVFSYSSAFADVLYDDIAAQKDTQSVYTNETYGYKEASLLKELEVIKEIGDLESEITRGEFCNILAYLLMVVDLSDTSAAKRFSDVYEVTKYLEQISAVSTMGYMVGYEDLKFKPDEIISLNEAICVFVKALGYEALAEQKGGYFDGYNEVANMLDLYDGFKGNRDALKKSDIYTLIGNFLEAEVLYMTMDGNGTVLSWENSGVTYLNDKFDVYEYKGRITDNGKTSIKSEKTVGDGNTVIEGETYHVGNTDIENMLGSYVEGYYKDDDGDKTLLTVIENEDKSNSISLSIDDITEISPLMIEYDADSKSTSRKKKLNISYSADYIYNGLYTSSLTQETLDGIDIGDVKVIDYDDDKSYDLLIVNSYENMVVSTANATTEKIYGKYNGDSIDLSQYESYKIIRDGKEIAVNELHEFDVILILRNKNSVYIENINKAVYGTVSSTYSEGEVQYFVIEGEEYRLAKQYAEATSMDIKAGSVGNFYLTKNNRIVYFESENSEQIGILHKVMHISEDSGDESVLVKIFTDEGEWLHVYADEKVTVNGKSYERAALADASLGLVDSTGQTVRDVICYTLNKDGELKGITTPDESKPDEDALQPATDGAETLVWRDSGVFIRSPYLLKYKTSASTYFKVPKDPENTTDYSTRKGFPGSHDKSYTIQAYYTKYSSKELFSPDVIIEYKNGAAASTDGVRAYVVSNIVQGINSDNEPCEVIKVIIKGKELSYCAKDSKKINGIKPGDIIRLYYNGSDELVGYKKYFNMDNDAMYATVKYNDNGGTNSSTVAREQMENLWGADVLNNSDTSYYIGNFSTIDTVGNPTATSSYDFYNNQFQYRDQFMGTVKLNKNGLLVMTTTYGEDLMFTTTAGDQLYKAYVTVVNKTDSGIPSVVVSKVSNINIGDKVFIRCHDGHACDIVVYR